jgi:hypothetical protein
MFPCLFQFLAEAFIECSLIGMCWVNRVKSLSVVFVVVGRIVIDTTKQ